MIRLVILVAILCASCASKQAEYVARDPKLDACFARLIQVAGSGPATDAEKAAVSRVCGETW